MPVIAKTTARFVCQSCGALTPKWSGRCEGCGEWNTIVEEAAAAAGPGLAAARTSPATHARPPKIVFEGLAGSAGPPPRAPTGIAELDRVLGGGLVAGSAVLLGGDPGIGKSTLLLQAAAGMAAAGRRVLYVSGEEAVEQLRLRARRLDLAATPLGLAASINLRDIAATLEAEASPERGRSGAGGDRLDPDHVARQHRVCPRHGQARCAPAPSS